MTYIGAKPSSGRSGIWLPEAVRRRVGAGQWKDPLREWGATAPGSVTWTLTHSLTSPGETLIQPAAQYNAVLVRAYGGGGSASFDNGGNGGGGGYVEAYFTLNPALRDFLAVVGAAGAQAQNGSSYTRLSEDMTSASVYGPRAFGGGGGPTTQAMGGGGQYWGGGGGGLSGVFWADSAQTSSQGARYFYCTPIAIAGGGGGGQSYTKNGGTGGSTSGVGPNSGGIRAGQTIEDATFTRGTDALSGSVRYTAANLYLRGQDNSGGGGFAGGTANAGGSSFVWGRTSTPTDIGQAATRALLAEYPGVISSTFSAPAGVDSSQTPNATTDRPGTAGQGGTANGGLGQPGAIRIYMGTI